MFVQREWLAVWGLSCRRRSKNLGAPRVERPRRREPVDCCGPAVAGIDLNQWLRPISLLSVNRFHLLTDIVRMNRRERRCEPLVVGNDGISQRKYVEALPAHRSPSRSRVLSALLSRTQLSTSEILNFHSRPILWPGSCRRSIHR